MISLAARRDHDLAGRDDDELMMLAAADHEPAMEEIVGRYQQRVRSYCRKWDNERGDDGGYWALWPQGDKQVELHRLNAQGEPLSQPVPALASLEAPIRVTREALVASSDPLSSPTTKTPGSTKR